MLPNCAQNECLSADADTAEYICVPCPGEPRAPRPHPASGGVYPLPVNSFAVVFALWVGIAVGLLAALALRRTTRHTDGTAG